MDHLIQRRLVALFVVDFVCTSVLFVINTVGFYESPFTPTRLAEANARITAAEARPTKAASTAPSEPAIASSMELPEAASVAANIALTERNEAIKAKTVSLASLAVLLVNLFVLYPFMRRGKAPVVSQ
jgi:hypothetical protein